MRWIGTVLTTQDNTGIAETFGTSKGRAPARRNFLEVCVAEVVDGVVVDVSRGLAAFDLITSGRQQVLDPVPDVRHKPFSVAGLLAQFVHVFLESKVAISSGPSKHLTLSSKKNRKKYIMTFS